MHILITGATGLIGSALMQHFKQQNTTISVLTRNPNSITQDGIRVYTSLDKITADTKLDIIINLAGAPISQRWSSTYKQTLVNSRLDTTKAINALLQRLHSKPQRLINASAVGYYGNTGADAVSESSTPCAGFTHNLCQRWEQEATAATQMGTKVSILRLGVVLDKGHGILKATAPIFKLGLGGTIGSGNQYLSWIHIDDVVRAIAFILSTHPDSATYNLTSPYPVTNAQWTKTLAATLNRPALLPLPTFIVKILFGEMGEALLLNGQKALPQKLLEVGFEFQYPRLEQALRQILT